MRTLCLQMIAALVLLVLPVMVSAEAAPTAGKLLVDIRLEASETSEERAYLGLSDSGSFNPTTIAGRLLVIEIFSMCCPHCQREAPTVNRLYQAIQASETFINRLNGFLSLD